MGLAACLYCRLCRHYADQVGQLKGKFLLPEPLYSSPQRSFKKELLERAAEMRDKAR